MSGLYPILFALLLSGAGTLMIWTQQQRITVAEQAIKSATDEAVVARNEATRHVQALGALNQTLQSERNSQVSLRAQQDRLRQGLSRREYQIKVLKDENAVLRQWATLPLPVTARRLRERPTLTGADAYDQWLSSRDALYPLVQPSPNER